LIVDLAQHAVGLAFHPSWKNLDCKAIFFDEAGEDATPQ
jgi:hypothetical protein